MLAAQEEQRVLRQKIVGLERDIRQLLSLLSHLLGEEHQ
jgi:hypothetical protein